MSPDTSKKTFFRQSGWLVLCTVVSGMLFYAVHFLSKGVSEDEYAIFGTLLGVLNCLGIPALGLQMVFAQQTAAAVSEEDHRRLARTVHGVLAGCFVIWAVVALVVLGFHREISSGWKLSNEAALWLMLLVALAMLWLPVFTGLLQGRQNFLWMGWALIFNSVGRVGMSGIIVLIFCGAAAGMTLAVLIGITVTLAISCWHSWESWMTRGTSIDWKPWLSWVVPLTLGFGAFQFMFSADVLFMQWNFDSKANASYVMAGTLGRALCTFTVPVVAVMFPKIVRSAARSEKSNVLGLTLLITGGLVGIGALGLAVVAPWILPLVGRPQFAEAAPLLRWFALSMVPLAMANVLLNDLLARNRFKLVPWLVAVAVGYGLTLTQFKPANKAFETSDIKNLPVFAAQLRQPTNAITAFVAAQLSPETRRQVSEFSAGNDPRVLTGALVMDLNRLCSGACLYESNRFASVEIQKQTMVLLKPLDVAGKQPNGEELVRLNRMLLQDAFPKHVEDSAYAQIIQTLGGFSVLFLLIVSFFHWLDGRSRRAI